MNRVYIKICGSGACVRASSNLSPLNISSTNMREAASVGWNASQKTWSCLLEQMLEIGRHGIWAFNSPSPQQAPFTLPNPAKGMHTLVNISSSQSKKFSTNHILSNMLVFITCFVK
ncbi:hypothetical protein VIGAN_05216000 [Vigna angularis var. angularis]|uniref:Uncharacterized protein n=1 Tax=Vigna angularis var. angularis TaxID=157739 RepID=A0A0S3S6Z0_PHAAN|nr:hypothetical protein VIGAN_05216000 [Vigna angularis var. angularis]